MMYDCFPFFNELDLLEIRLNTLNKVVDKFILVEASKTQSLVDKPFYFEENKGRYKEFLDKIIHVKVEDHPATGGWAMENFQRNCIVRGLCQANLMSNDTVAISDLDEIWNPIYAEEVEKLLSEHKFVSMEMKYLVFYLNLETVDKKWTGTIFTKGETLIDHTPQQLRNMKDHVPEVEDGGWHFGYQGGKEMVYKKYLSCIEPFDKSALPSFEKFSEEFEARIKDGGSFIFSDNLGNDSIKLKKVNIDESYPEYLSINKNNIKHLIYE